MPLLFLKKAKVLNQGYLPEEDSHTIYFKEYGNKNGPIILWFHDGPGGQINEKITTLFNLKRFHLITFDQRGSGHSFFKHINQNRILFKMPCD